MTELRISLAPDGLTVILPTGYTLTVGANEAGARFIERLLRDSEEYERTGERKSGYIGAYPTQAIADKMLRQSSVTDEEIADFHERKAAATAEEWLAKGIDVSKIRIEI